MAVEGVLASGVWAMLRLLPGFLLRMFFSESKLAGLVHADLRPRNDAATVNLGQCATYDIWLQVMNRSPVTVELDQGAFRFWCVGSILNSYVVKKQKIAPGQSIDILIRDVIPDGHADHIAKQIGSSDAALEGDLEFTCKVRPFAKSLGHLSGIKPRVINATFRNGGA